MTLLTTEQIGGVRFEKRLSRGGCLLRFANDKPVWGYSEFERQREAAKLAEAEAMPPNWMLLCKESLRGCS